MNFDHTDDRQMLADTLGRYLLQHYPIDVRLRAAASRSAYAQEHWAALAELGMIGALVETQHGGFGGTGFDIAAIFEHLGRALVIEPFLSALMAGRALGRTGSQEALIEKMIAGDALVAFAHEEPQSRYELADIASLAVRDRQGWSLTGHKAVVLQVEAADQILVSARVSGAPGDQAGIGLFLVRRAAPGMDIRGYDLIDGGRAGELELRAAPAVLVAEEAFALIEDSVAAGLVALCWEAVGVMEVLKSATLDYLRTRRQFGVPIGKFQALQHRMATFAIEVEQMRSAAINAADALDGDRRQRELAVSAAKFTAGRVGTIVAEEVIQMHGGIGMTWELPLSHFAKRLTMIGHQLGDEDHHLRRFSQIGQPA